MESVYGRDSASESDGEDVHHRRAYSTTPGSRELPGLYVRAACARHAPPPRHRSFTNTPQGSV
eukprot:9015921-Pyramimonas_sp.AAC.1